MHVITRFDGTHGDDDDCPLCVAAREGRPISFDALYEPAYLIAEAHRVLTREKLAPGEEAIIVDTGRLMPDNTYELTQYAVDAEGCIYLTKNGTRSFVMRVPLPTTPS